MSQITTPELASNTTATLLLVDDEPNILAALKRQFLQLGYKVLTAESGAEALALLEKETVDLLISDMRMPQMTGADVLEQVRSKWPDVVRILLTGYSDLTSTIAAINRGEIYRYISKPWNDDEIVLVVQDALERKQLVAEKRRLEALTLHQNEELKVLNARLEDKVRQRTEELRDALEQLKKDYFASIQIFANLMELRKGTTAGLSRRVAQLCRNIALKMHLSETYVRSLEAAALLHDIGKVGLPDRLLDKPYMELTNDDRAEFDKHPLRGAAILMGLAPLADAAQMIRCHREHFDGVENLIGLRASDIPLGARILLVASDYESMQAGLIVREMLTPNQALEMISYGIGIDYDPAVVDVLGDIAAKADQAAHVGTEFQLSSDQLHEGMLLTRDIVTSNGNGAPLLLKDTLLNSAHIREIKEFEMSDGESLAIYTRSI